MRCTSHSAASLLEAKCKLQAATSAHRRSQCPLRSVSVNLQDSLGDRIIQLQLDEACEIDKTLEERVIVFVFDHKLLGVIDAVQNFLVKIKHRVASVVRLQARAILLFAKANTRLSVFCYVFEPTCA